jgi:AsmA-like C-terminal region
MVMVGASTKKMGGMWRYRWLVWVAGALVVIVCVLVILVAIKSPFTEGKVAASLEETVRANVSFGKYRMTYFPHPGCVAENVTFTRSGGAKNIPPLVTIQRLEIESHYTDMIVRPGYVALVKVNGLRVQIPPQGTNAGSPTSPPSESTNVRVGEIVADGAVLEIGRSGDTPPLKFEMHSLTVRSFAHNSEWSYRVSMKNAEPPGEIISKGKFGPLNLEQLETTPLSGDYKFRQADLSVFDGIAGTLSSTGEFGGKLGEVVVRGALDIPDFEVVRSKHKVHLTSRFNANVNGTNGDVFLKQVETSFLQTSVATSGSVASKAGQDGKTTSVDVEVSNGRIQDLLVLLAATKHAPMNGTTSFKAHVTILPLGRPFLKELLIHGDFGVEEAAFRKPSRQEQVDELSERARGEKKGKDKDKDQSKEQSKPDSNAKADPGSDDPENIVMNLRGHLELREGVAKFSELTFNVPGASARMNGTYNLENEQIDFHGTLKTEAEISQDTTGIKSALLKPLNPLFKRKKAGADIPVKMTGTYHDPKFGFDVAGAVK